MSKLELAKGFRRRFRITPGDEVIQAEVEDDFHCMSVIVHHDGKKAMRVVADLRRAPWSTCPGAEAALEKAFAGVELTAFPGHGDKSSNCTHLYDLALLAAAHADDENQTIYDILVSDPVDNQRHAEVRKNGETLLHWIESEFRIVSPDNIAGVRIDQLRSWIKSLKPMLQEPARLLQWANMLANGRIIPLADQSDATKMPPSCYTFQPERAVQATRIGRIRDFSEGIEQPLDEYKTVV